MDVTPSTYGFLTGKAMARSSRTPFPTEAISSLPFDAAQSMAALSLPVNHSHLPGC
jgi:hypothetical protein